MVDWLAGKRMRGTSTERTTGTWAVLPAGSVGGWVELGRATITSTTSDTLTVPNLDNKRYYMVLLNEIPDTYCAPILRMGNGSVDENSNYARRVNENGGSDSSTGNPRDHITWTPEGGDDPQFNVGYITNLSGSEKLAINHTVHRKNAGATNAVGRGEVVGKWTNISNPLDVLQINNSGAGSGDHGVGSEFIVLGWDDSDTHTNNFWEELHSDSQTGQTVDNIDSGTFTNKKYLWVQLWTKGTLNTTVKMSFNNSTDSTYAYRYSINGATDPTPITSASNVPLHATKANATKFFNIFIINDGSNEILGMSHSAEDGGSGATNDPHRRETAFKRSTSTPITRIEFDNDDTGNFTDWEFKIWGAD